MSKNVRLAIESYFSGLGSHLASKSIPVPSKRQECEQQNQTKLLDEVWVRAYRFDFDPELPASTVDVNSRFSRFQLSAFLANGLASSIFIFVSILLRFFFKL